MEEAYRANWFTNFGTLSRRLEGALSQRWGGPDTECILVSNGTTALAAPLIAAGLESRRVLLPAFTFPATLSAVKMAGAIPVLVDVDAETWRVSAATLAEAFMSTGAAAAIVLAPFGLQSDFGVHAEVAAAHNALLIVDNAAGLGVVRNPIEARPHVFEACSLHATKPFGVGEGGVIFAHRACEPSLRSAINFALPTLEQADGPRWGINGKLSEFHAAVGLAVLEDNSNKIKRRQLAAARYAKVVSAFADVSFVSAVESSPWQFFPILMPSRKSADAFVDHAAQAGMEIRRYYRPSLSRLTDIERAHPCLASESLSERMCCAPIYSQADEAEREEMPAIVANALAATFGGAVKRGA